jgi:hypothetical protein
MWKCEGRIYTDEQRAWAREALNELQAGQFLSGHELYERGFRATSGRLRSWFHGLAQVAASHHQLTLGRGRAAVRTWRKARDKLAALGVLTREFEAAMDAFHARLGLSAEEPRFFDTQRLGPPQSFPLPVAETLHTPSA